MHVKTIRSSTPLALSMDLTHCLKDNKIHAHLKMWGQFRMCQRVLTRSRGFNIPLEKIKMYPAT